MHSPRPMMANAVVTERAAPSGVTGRIALAGLTALLLTGAWLRFNDRIATVVPALAAPGTAASAVPVGLVELALLPQREAMTAVATMGLSTSEAALLTDALRRGRLRLVRMPVFDAQPGLSTPLRTVRVSAGGYTTSVTLSAQPATVTLPVGPVGTVQFVASGNGPASVGALTLNGPVRFPDLPAGQVLEVGVIAQ